MPYDSSGNFTLVPGTIVSDGMTIQPSQHNPPFQDVAGGLSMVFVRDGRAPMTGPVNMNGNKITNAADGSADSDVATIGQAGFKVGDFKDTARTLDSKWLRRNGGAYSSAVYPDLATFFPPIPSGVSWNSYTPSGLIVTSNPTRMTNGELGVVGGGSFQKSSNWSLMSSVATYTPAASTVYNFCDVLNGVYLIVSIGFAPIPQSYSTVSVSLDGGETFSLSGFPFGSNTEYLTIFNNKAIIIASKDKKVFTSEDGITWDSHDVTEFLGLAYLPSWSSVESEGILYLVCKDNNEYSVFTDDGINYTRGSPVNANGITKSGSYFIAVANGGVIYRTTDFENGPWTAVTSGTTQNLNSVLSLGGGNVIAVGDGVTLLSTNDGAGWITTATSETRNILKVVQYQNETNSFVGGVSGALIKGEYSTSALFRVPNDDPTYGWIRALP